MFGNSRAEQLRRDDFFALPFFEELRALEAEEFQSIGGCNIENVAELDAGGEEDNGLDFVFFVAGMLGACGAAVIGKVNAGDFLRVVTSGFAGAEKPVGRIMSDEICERRGVDPDGVDFGGVDLVQTFQKRGFTYLHISSLRMKVAQRPKTR